MSGLSFLDTNVLVYAYDSNEPRKQVIAQGLLKRAVLGELMISTQVLAEFAVTFLHKAAKKRPPSEVKKLLDVLAPIRLIVPDAEIVRRAVEAREAYGLHFYDGMIVAAAERGGCEQILSEDLNAQQYFGIEVTNPF